MKPFGKYRLLLLIISTIGGMLLAAFLIFTLYGEIGSIGFIALSGTLVIVLTIMVIMVKTGNSD